MKPNDYVRFEQTVEWMEKKAREYGLDFFPMRYEFCPADTLYRIAGAGMPTRFQHWSFGKHYFRQKLDFDVGLSRIYELVVNNDPCYAFFLENNSILQNEMIVAHVLGHSDFFKHNARFAKTNRQMVETMSVTAERFRHYEEVHGLEAVEQVIDSALAIAEHIDASATASMALSADSSAPISRKSAAAHTGSVAGPYEDLWNLDRKDSSEPELSAQVTTEANKDLLHFLIMHGVHLKDWQRDILSSIREEMMYFWPQLETKIMNEGWATYWHTKLMQDMELSVEDSIEFAKLTSGVTQPHRFQVNPYNVGFVIWKYIQRDYGAEEMFIVRESDSDVGFLRNFLTQDIVDECDLYLYEKRGNSWVIAERDYKVIRDNLIGQRINCGFPVIYVADSDYHGNGGLCLHHAYEGIELDPEYIQKTLPHVFRLWGRAVSLQTTVNNHQMEYSFDGTNFVMK